MAIFSTSESRLTDWAIKPVEGIMTFFLTLSLILTSPGAFANWLRPTDAQLQFRAESMRELNLFFDEYDQRTDSAIDFGESLDFRNSRINWQACEGLEEGFTRIMQFEPTSACPKTRKQFDSDRIRFRALINKCKSMFSFLQSYDPTSCTSPSGRDKTIAAFDTITRPEWDLSTISAEMETALTDNPKGEMNDFDCALSALILWQGRGKSLRIAIKLQGAASFYVEDFCTRACTDPQCK